MNKEQVFSIVSKLKKLRELINKGKITVRF